MTKLVPKIRWALPLVATLLAAPAFAQQAMPVDPPSPLEKPAQQQPMPTEPPAPPEKPAQSPATAAPMPTPAPPKPAAAAEAPAEEPDPDMQRVNACKAQALAKLKQQSPSIDDIFIDVDGLTIAEADGKLGDTAVKGVLMGEAYIQRDRSDRVNRFLCLTGANGEVLFTFFTER